MTLGHQINPMGDRRRTLIHGAFRNSRLPATCLLECKQTSYQVGFNGI